MQSLQDWSTQEASVFVTNGASGMRDRSCPLSAVYNNAFVHPCSRHELLQVYQTVLCSYERLEHRLNPLVGGVAQCHAYRLATA